MKTKLNIAEMIILSCILILLLLTIPYQSLSDIFSFIAGGGIISFFIAKFVIQKPINNKIEQYLSFYDDKDYEFFKKVADIFNQLEKDSKTLPNSSFRTAENQIHQAYDSIFGKVNKSN